MMNIHHGTLFPDAIGASLYCNNWVGSQNIAATAVEPPPLVCVTEVQQRPVRIINGFEIFQLPNNLPQLIKKSTLDTTKSMADAEDAAASITKVFEENAGPDWHKRAANLLLLRLKIQKLLAVRGWSKTHAKSLASLVINHFASIAEPQSTAHTQPSVDPIVEDAQ